MCTAHAHFGQYCCVFVNKDHRTTINYALFLPGFLLKFAAFQFGVIRELTKEYPCAKECPCAEEAHLQKSTHAPAKGAPTCKRGTRAPAKEAPTCKRVSTPSLAKIRQVNSPAKKTFVAWLDCDSSQQQSAFRANSSTNS